MTIYTIVFTACAVVALVATEHLRATKRPTPLVWVFKPLASVGFIVTAIAAGAMLSPFGVMMLAALGCCAIGDVLLIPRDNDKVFLAGMGAFLAGHLCFITAFLYKGVAPSGLLAAAGAMLVIGGKVIYWLWAYTAGPMRTMVVVYVVVFSSMVVTASAASVQAGTVLFANAAAFFVVADIMTARQQFVCRTFMNKVLGLPLYYAAQLLFAVGAGG